MIAAHRFDRDTAVVLVDAGQRDDAPAHTFDARIDEGWWIVAGPNGGYLNALLLRGMVDAVRDATGDAARTPRTQTTHFTARARPGSARVATTILRSGRSLSTVSARLEQDGVLIAYSLAALGTARRSDSAGEERVLAFQDASMPEVPPPERVEIAPVRAARDGAFPFHERFEKRPVFGTTEPSSRVEATTGGWIRPLPERAGDALLLAALVDAWPPAIFHKQPPGPTSRGVPTIELTVHFRAPDVAATIAPGDYYLARFATRTARDGFLEEDGEIWSASGVLLAQSRQLALLA